jgi:hypothetical protein
VSVDRGLEGRLRDLAEARAGGGVPAPGADVVDDVRRRGVRRRRRRMQAAGAIGAALVAGVLAIAVVRPFAVDDARRVDVVVEPPPTTTPPVPPAGSPAAAWVGVPVRGAGPGSSELAAAGGAALPRLSLRAVRAVGTAATLLLVADGDRPLAWLVDGGWPGGGPVLAAADLPPGSSATAACTAPGVPAEEAVVAAQAGPDDPAVVAAWRASTDGTLTPLAPATVTCPAD